MVARLGLTAKKAYELTLDRITINHEGRLVIQPADAWFPLPKHLVPIIEKLAREADSEWPFSSPEMAAPIPIFASVIKRRQFKQLFNSEAKLLRSSALFAAMHAGKLDRQSLVAITGVSYPTITHLEYMVSTDIHTFVSPKLAKARNNVILGIDDNSDE